MKKRKNAGEGYGYMFHGAFTSKADAVKKEAKRKGSFIKAAHTANGYRYIVMTPRLNPVKRKKKIVQVVPVPAVNPSELLILGANPSPCANPASPNREITLPAGSTLTIRVNPTAELAQNGILSKIGNFLHDQTYAGRLSLAEHRAARVARKGSKWDRMSREKRRAIAISAGVSSSIADAWSKLKFRDIPEGWRDTIMRAVNPLCGAMIGGETCTRQPGHRGPHLPQGATMRTQTRLRKGWRPRGNPSAAALRESFTGSPAEFFTVESEPHMPAGDYAQLGELLALYVKPRHGGQVQQINFSSRKPIVVCDESARQIYFVGGDQDVSGSVQSVFGSTSPHTSGLVELGEARRIDYKQRKEHVPDPNNDEWRHEFGEESGVRPKLFFDVNAKRLLLQGGEYVVRTEGIVN